MGSLDYLLAALTPLNLLLALGGVIAGTVIGALPGLTATMAVAVLVPFTFTMAPAAALIALGAIYTGAIYGGAYAAILLNTPGTPSSIATTFDGYPMARKGDGDLALTLACLASVVGGLVGAGFLLVLAPPMATVALKFGPVEYFWLGLFGLTLIASLGEGSTIKGLIGGGIGLLLSMVGVAEVGGDIRYVGDFKPLLGGIDVVSALIGLYCIPVLIDLVATPVAHLETGSRVASFRLAEACSIIQALQVQPGAQFHHRHRGRHPAGRRRIDRLAGVVFGGQAIVAAARQLRQGRTRRRAGHRIGQQRHRGWRLHSDAGARHPGHTTGRDHPGRAAGAGHPHRPDAVHGAGADRLHLHLGPDPGHADHAAGGTADRPLRVPLHPGHSRRRCWCRRWRCSPCWAALPCTTTCTRCSRWSCSACWPGA